MSTLSETTGILYGVGCGEIDFYMLKNIKKENQRLNKKIKALEKLVWIDFLTQVYNRRAFATFIRGACREVAWTKKHKTRRKLKPFFSLLLIDLNGFKAFNDKFGHLAGDQILKKTAKLLKKTVREFDVVARWGGDEFAIILRQTNLTQAKKKAEFLVEQANKKLPVTLSVGITQSNPNYSSAKFFKTADQALYQAKKSGKNQIRVSK